MSQSLSSFFGHSPTADQLTAIKELERFASFSSGNQIFVLKGYAGTGKTTLMGSFIQYLKYHQKNFLLMAPTGRAAKVLSLYSGEQAFTIHKSIYYQGAIDGRMVFTLQKNKLNGAYIIVDEASMIGNGGSLGTSFNSLEKTLLDDLIQFTFSGQGCKLIFIGDTAQLPPVGTPESPALDPEFLSRRYPINLFKAELKEVTRQALNSGILYNATKIRDQIQDNNFQFPILNLNGFQDCRQLFGTDIEETVAVCYSRDGLENTVVICRSNKQANSYNKYIRYQVLFMEEELCASDFLMVVKNNYYWLKDHEKSDFIANGEIIEVLRVINFEEKFGFRFANVTIKINKEGTDGDVTTEVKLLLDSLYTEVPALTKEQNKQLFEQVVAFYEDIKDNRKRMKAVKEDPYFNALQVKFAYAITCHKSQGGQWQNVFVDQGYLTEEMMDVSYLRWLYTAVTRATEKLYLLNFNEQFFA